MNDTSDHDKIPQEEDSGLAFDHPLLEQLNMFDRIVVTSHYATLVRNTIINVELLTYTRLLNTLTLAIQTAPELSEEQKIALAGFGAHIQQRIQNVMVEAQSDAWA
jgi:hypothetical protein